MLIHPFFCRQAQAARLIEQDSDEEDNIFDDFDTDGNDTEVGINERLIC